MVKFCNESILEYMIGFLVFCVRRALDRLPNYLRMENDSSPDWSIFMIASRSWAALGLLGKSVENTGVIFIKNP